MGNTDPLRKKLLELQTQQAVIRDAMIMKKETLKLETNLFEDIYNHSKKNVSALRDPDIPAYHNKSDFAILHRPNHTNKRKFRRNTILPSRYQLGREQGAPGGTRTPNHLIRSQPLYPLSHEGKL